MASRLTHTAIGTSGNHGGRQPAGLILSPPAHARHSDRTHRIRRHVASSSAPIQRLDDWVLCRIYNKKGVIERYDTVDDDDAGEVTADVKPAAVAAAKNPRGAAAGAGGRGGAAPMKVEMADYGGYYDDYDLETPSAGMLCFDRPSAAALAPSPAPALSPTEPDPDRDSSSMPWHMHTDNSSSGSEHVLSPSPDLPDRDHAESQPGGGGGWWPGGDWADDGFVVLDDGGALFGPPSPGLFARVDAAAAAAFGDMFAYLQKPF